MIISRCKIPRLNHAGNVNVNLFGRKIKFIGPYERMKRRVYLAARLLHQAWTNTDEITVSTNENAGDGRIILFAYAFTRSSIIWKKRHKKKGTNYDFCALSKSLDSAY